MTWDEFLKQAEEMKKKAASAPLDVKTLGRLVYIKSLLAGGKAAFEKQKFTNQAIGEVSEKKLMENQTAGEIYRIAKERIQQDGLQLTWSEVEETYDFLAAHQADRDLSGKTKEEADPKAFRLLYDRLAKEYGTKDLEKRNEPSWKSKEKSYADHFKLHYARIWWKQIEEIYVIPHTVRIRNYADISYDLNRKKMLGAKFGALLNEHKADRGNVVREFREQINKQVEKDREKKLSNIPKAQRNVNAIKEEIQNYEKGILAAEQELKAQKENLKAAQERVSAAQPVYRAANENAEYEQEELENEILKIAYAPTFVSMAPEEQKGEKKAEGKKKDSVAEENGNAFSFTFTKAFRENLASIRSSAEKSENKGVERSQQFQDLKNSVDEFWSLFKDDSLFQEGMDGTDRLDKLNTLIGKMGELKTAARNYYNKPRSGFWPTGRHRKGYARGVLRFIERNEKSIERLYENLQKDLSATDERRQQAREAGQSEIARNLSSASEAFEEAQKDKEQAEKAIERIERKISENKNKLQKSQKLLSAGQKLADQTASEANRIFQGSRISREAGKEKIKEDRISGDKAQAKDQKIQAFKADALCYELSRKLFSPGHNPVADYSEDFEQEERMKGYTFEFPGKLEGDSGTERLKLSDLKAGLEGVANLTYSPDALLTVSNLRLMDQLMGVKRAPLDYYVDYEFWDGKKKISGDEVRRNLEFYKNNKKKTLVCIVKGVRSGRLSDIDGKIGERTENSAGIPEFAPARGELFDAETATSVMDLDSSAEDLQSLLPSDLMNMDPPLGFIRSRVKYFRGLMSERSQQIESRLDKAEFNVISAKKLRQDILFNRIAYEKIKNKDNVFTKAPGYYDPEMVQKLDLNYHVTGGLIKTDIKEKLTDQDIAVFKKDHVLLLKDRELAEKFLKPILAMAGKGTRLGEIADEIRQILDMPEQELYSFDTKYVTENGVLDKEPGEACLRATSYTSHYENLARNLYAKIKGYLEDNKPVENNPKDPSNLLNQWKKKVYFEEGKAFTPGRHDIVINANLDRGKETVNPMEGDLREFDGDAGYLQGMKILLHNEQYYDLGGTAKGKKASEKRMELARNLQADHTEFVLKDFKDTPIFTKLPSMGDIKQGAVGNCFFLAALGSVIKSNPAKIFDLIHDNGDGSVTCKFFRKQGDLEVPCFVTVSKKLVVAESGKTKDGSPLFSSPSTQENLPLWAHLLQKAYCLSGIRELYNGKMHLNRFVNKAAALYKIDKRRKKDIYRRIIKERLPGMTDAKLQALSEDKMASMVMHLVNRTQGANWAGFPAEVAENLTGERYQIEGPEKMSLDEIVKLLEDIPFHASKFTSCDPAALSADERKILKLIGVSAAGKIRRENISYAKDNGGESFMTTRVPGLENVINAIQEACSHGRKNELRQFAQDTVEKVGKYLIRGLEDFHQKSKKAYGMLMSERPGQYTPLQNELFDKIDQKTKKGEYVFTDFNKLDKASGHANLDAVTQENIMGNGLISEHAYSILGCTREGDVKYLIIRNPWAMGSREKVSASFADGEKVESYYANHDEVYSENSGIFKMELNDFYRNVNGIEMKVPTNGPEKVQTAVAEHMLSLVAQSNPEKFKNKIQSMSNEEILQTTKNSPLTHHYTDKVINYQGLTERAKRNQLTENEAQLMKDLKKELFTIFGKASAKEKIKTVRETLQGEKEKKNPSLQSRASKKNPGDAQRKAKANAKSGEAPGHHKEHSEQMNKKPSMIYGGMR